MSKQANFTVERHGNRAVYRVTWAEVERVLGHAHRNVAADDAALARALRAAGARPTTKGYSAADGWHVYAPKGTPLPAMPRKSNPGPRRTKLAARARDATALAMPHPPSPVKGPKKCQKCGKVHTKKEHARHRNVAAKMKSSAAIKRAAKRKAKTP